MKSRKNLMNRAVSEETFTRKDLDSAASATREYDSRLRNQTEGVVLLALGALETDMVRHMPADVSGERAAGYVEAVRDPALMAGFRALDHDPATRSLVRSPCPVVMPLSLIDQALAARGSRAVGEPATTPACAGEGGQRG